MQSLMRCGGLAVVCGVLTSACGGDTSGERPTANGQPSSGNGGGGAGGQTAAAGGRGGGAATGMGGTGTTPTTYPPACTSCVELQVTISTDAFKSVQYVFRPADPGADLSTAVITWRVRALTPATEIAGNQMFVAAFATNGAPNYTNAFGAQTALTAANGFDPADSNAWVDLTLDFNRVGPVAPTDGAPPAAATDAGVDGGSGAGPAPAPGGAFILSMIDKTVVTQVGLQMGTIAAFTGTGAVRIAVDSVTVTGVAATVFATRTFDTALEGLVQNNYQVPANTPMPLLRPM